jgi:hypothetical protein
VAKRERPCVCRAKEVPALGWAGEPLALITPREEERAAAEEELSLSSEEEEEEGERRSRRESVEDGNGEFGDWEDEGEVRPRAVTRESRERAELLTFERKRFGFHEERGVPVRTHCTRPGCSAASRPPLTVSPADPMEKGSLRTN